MSYPVTYCLGESNWLPDGNPVWRLLRSPAREGESQSTSTMMASKPPSKPSKACSLLFNWASTGKGKFHCHIRFFRVHFDSINTNWPSDRHFLGSWILKRVLLKCNPEAAKSWLGQSTNKLCIQESALIWLQIVLESNALESIFFAAELGTLEQVEKLFFGLSKNYRILTLTDSWETSSIKVSSFISREDCNLPSMV